MYIEDKRQWLKKKNTAARVIISGSYTSSPRSSEDRESWRSAALSVSVWASVGGAGGFIMGFGLLIGVLGFRGAIFLGFGGSIRTGGSSRSAESKSEIIGAVFLVLGALVGADSFGA